MTDKTKSVVKVEPDNSVNALISQAITSNVPVETLERLFALREKVKAEQAKEAFVTALSGFQSECPVIEKKKEVLNKDKTSVRYKYAPIESIVEQIKAPLGKYGFSYTWKVVNDPGFIMAICKVTHELGHAEESDFKVPIDKDAYMTAPQQYAAALTFAKRYTLCNALGISTGDEDNDASDQKKEEKIDLITCGEKIGSCVTLDQLKEVWKNLTPSERNHDELKNLYRSQKNMIESENNPA